MTVHTAPIADVRSVASRRKRPAFRRKALACGTASLLALAAGGGAAYAGCTATNASVDACDTTSVIATPAVGESTLTIDGVDTVGVYYSPPDDASASAYSETLNLTGSMTIANPTGQSYVNGGAGVTMQVVGAVGQADVTLNATATVGSDVTIDSRAEYGGGVYLRVEYAGNVSINNAGNVTVVGVDNTNTPFSDASVNAGIASADGLTAVTSLGAATVVNSGDVTAYSGRGLYAEGNYKAVTLDGDENVTAINAPAVTVSADNAASGTVNAYLAGVRVINYYGLAEATNEGVAHSSERQALVAWSAAGDAYVSNSGAATADDSNAIVAASERGNATIVNSGAATASELASGSLGAAAGYAGLRAYADYTGDVSVTNTSTGVVTANHDAAIIAQTPQGNVTVVNQGQLSGLNGVIIDNGAGLGSIDSIDDTSATTDAPIDGVARLNNSGAITAVDYGVYMDGATNLLTNSGTITATSGAGVLIDSGGTGVITNAGAISGGVGVIVSGGVDIVNGGSISGGLIGEGPQRADAVELSGGGNTLMLEAGYQIVGDAVSTSGATNGGDTLALGGDADASFDVSQIVATQPEASTGAAQYYGFANYAKIGDGVWTLTGATQADTAWDIEAGVLAVSQDAALGGGSTLTIDGGTLEATAGFTSARTITLGGGGGTIATDAGVTLTLTGDLAGAGGLTKTGAGVLALDGSGAYAGPTTVAEGELIVGSTAADASASIVSDVTVESGAALAGHGSVGSVTVRSGGVLAPGGSIGTLTVNGDLTLAPGAVYAVEVDPSTATSDLTLVTGAAHLDGEVQGVVIDGLYRPGVVYTLLTAEGGVSGTFSGVSLASPFAFLAPQLSYGAADVYLQLVRNQTRMAAFAHTPNQAAAANALDGLPDTSLLADQVLSMRQGADFARLYDDLSGEIHATAAGAVLQDAMAFGDLIIQHAAAPRAAGGTGWPLWAQVDGDFTRRGGDGNAGAASQSSGGLTFGLEHELAGDWVLGGAFRYSHDDVSESARNSHANIDSYSLGVYAARSWPASGMGAEGRIKTAFGGVYGWNRLSTTRNVDFTGFGQSDTAGYGAENAQAFGEVGYEFTFRALSVEPYAGAAWTHLRTDGFTEAGGDAALAGRGTTNDVASTTLGLRGRLPTAAQGLTLDGGLAWRHLYDGVDPKAVLAFDGGPNFTVAGTPLARDAALVNLGLTYQAGQGVSLSAAYDGQFGQRVDASGGRLAVRWRF